MADRSDVSRGEAPRCARIGSRTRAVVWLAFAIASLDGLMACSGDDSSATPDGGAQGHDASSDTTAQAPVDGGGGGTDTGTDDATLDAGADGALAPDVGADTAPTPTGDAGEPCTPPLNACGPGLYCNSSNICATSYCSGKPQKPLPYAIAGDFQTVFTIGPEKANLAILPSGADCDTTTYPPIPNTGLGDAGADGAPDGGYPALGDGGVQTVTYPSAPSCYELLFDPSCTNGTQGLCWAGAEFTNSAATAAAAKDGNVTPSAIGVCLAQGATVISFSARSSVDGSIVKFGSTRPGACLKVPITGADGGPPDPATEQASCPGATEFYIALTTSWQRYTISLAPGEPYNDEPNTGGGVWNGFSMVVEPAKFVGGAYLFVKDIVWGASKVDIDAGIGSDAGGDAGGDAAADASSD
jgi:hypothetical protein